MSDKYEYVCNACGFRAPMDTVGAEIIKAHLKEEHDYVLPSPHERIV